MAVTALNPAARERPPHVVLQVMESMGHHLSSLDAPGRDLLGALRPHWESDWRFDRFVSEGNGTIDSLARLLVRSPMKAIGQSSAASAKFAGNAFAPYLQRGYRVLFVTSGTATWRNLGLRAPAGRARVHRPADAAPALSRGADRHLGVPDEYMFRYMEERLAEADRAGQPCSSWRCRPPITPFTPPPGAGGRDLALDEATRAKHFHDWTGIDDVLGAALRQRPAGRLHHAREGLARRPPHHHRGHRRPQHPGRGLSESRRCGPGPRGAVLCVRPAGLPRQCRL